MNNRMLNGVKAFLLLAGCSLLYGCGSSSTGIQLTGKVTFDGQPVETGKITFEPQQSGTMTMATIANGSYQLSSDRPAKPGTYLVRITADRSTGRVVADSRSQEDQPAEEMVQYLPEKYNMRSELTVNVAEGSDGKYDFALTSK